MRIELLKRRQVIAILTALLENFEQFADGREGEHEVGMQKQDFVDRLGLDTKGVNAAMDALLADHYILHFSRPPKILWALTERGTYLAFLLRECIAETGVCKSTVAPLFQKHAHWLMGLKESLEK